MDALVLQMRLGWTEKKTLAVEVFVEVARRCEEIFGAMRNVIRRVTWVRFVAWARPVR